MVDTSRFEGVLSKVWREGNRKVGEDYGVKYDCVLLKILVAPHILGCPLLYVPLRHEFRLPKSSLAFQVHLLGSGCGLGHDRLLVKPKTVLVCRSVSFHVKHFLWLPLRRVNRPIALRSSIWTRTQCVMWTPVLLASRR